MFHAKRHARTIGEACITWVVATEHGGRAVTYKPEATPVAPLSLTASVPAAPYRHGDHVWVHRDGIRRAGVVEGASEWAALVRYRCSDGAGTMVDTVPAGCLAIRAETDRLLDRESSEPDAR
jgi:hypothetical protein